MILRNVIEGLPVISLRGSVDVEIKGICSDSRHFQPGDLFIAVRGHQFDGHLFIGEACEKKASAVVVEDDRVVSVRFAGAVIKVNNSRSAVDVLAANFYAKPSENLFVAGVTGTNGKTTITHMIEAILIANKMPTGVIGTINNHLGKSVVASSHTTPDALELQKLLAQWITAGAKAVSIEVSSHALSLMRADSVHFDTAVFTNLTRDHLDFHKTMNDYIKAKARLFKELLKKSKKKNKRAIINIDDPHWESMMPDVPTWKYGLDKGDIKAENINLSFDGTIFKAITPNGSVDIHLQMIGRHNISNALGAIGVGLHAGVLIQTIAEALSKLEGVKGRLEKVASKSGIHVFVDYAHTDDALKNVLSFLKNLRDEKSPNARIITLFGCGGDRDSGKRPLMMKAAQSFSDLVVVTSDNPRTEDANEIIEDILGGASAQSLVTGENVIVEPDRRHAIELAIRKAKPGDVVLIAGKGHEDYQIIGTKKHPFDDVQVAREYLR
ncbi:MAG: UDP-N-acetylmuramoyl-L-alanyl-D-glutamate--2,6-diaminopimelate ligase [Oligoflexia bacterium]|nr:UDP-N-acetylmuramoyl-L-alanyl-D-glutamate--2,6-diaminopimelate ligase [Oligoflexia bacterium]